MSSKNKLVAELKTLSPSERRAVRAERIYVEDAEPYGWMAHSEASDNHFYHLYCEPESRRLVCTCADFIFRCDQELGYECKHVSATLKHIARQYLKTSYEPHKQQIVSRAA